MFLLINIKSNNRKQVEFIFLLVNSGALLVVVGCHININLNIKSILLTAV